MKMEITLLLRLVVATLFGALIGLEREQHGRPAGLRTHILVSLGSCLVMLISLYGFTGIQSRDPARLAAQVVSGIGFLGAGTILREGTSVRGLTTAASLWVVAGIGLAVGSGFYLAAGVTTIIAVLVLVFLDDFGKKFIGRQMGRIQATLADQPGTLAAFCQVLGKHGVSITSINLEIEEEKEKALISLQVKGHNIAKEKIIAELSALPDIFSVKWE